MEEIKVPEGTQQEILSLTDWRGEEYTVGDNILYARMSGRSVEVCEGTVLRMWKVASYHGRWQLRVRVQPNGKGSRDFYRTTTHLEWLDAEGNPTSYENAADDESLPPFKNWEPDGKGGYVEKEFKRKLSRSVKVEIKPVTLIVIENITKIDPRV